MLRLRRDAETQAGRLLRVLFVWVGAVSSDSGRAGRRCFGGKLLPLLNRGEAASAPQRDWARYPTAALAWWGIPIALAMSADLLTPSARVVALIWGAAFVWMGVGCLLNARRCHRLHCYFSGPVLLLGAVTVGLLAFGELNFGPHGLNNVIWGTLLLALLSFVPEVIWGQYTQHR